MLSTAPDTLHIAPRLQADGSLTVRKPVSRLETKKEIQARQRAWLSAVMETTRLKPSQIAKGANVSDTTLTRLLNNPDYTGTLEQATVDRIKETYKLPGPEEYAVGRKMPLIGFAEAERFDPKREQTDIARVVEAVLRGRNAVDAWRLKTSALETVGYLPGDLVMVDLNSQPEPQDAVCAQVYDWQRGGAETVWRVYDPPFLVGAAADRTAYKPLLVDNDRVIVKGVIITALRPHRLSATR